MADLSGHEIGRYHIIQKLGEGGMAVVYKAYDTRLERDVAIKFIRTEQIPPAMLEKMLKRFEREAKSLARMKHIHIINVFDYGEHEGEPYLVMDYIPGGTLKQRIGPSMSYQKAVQIVLPIASALEYAHKQGIVHRDVKPANILLTSGDEPLLSDFGIARILETENASTLTGTGVGIGTPEYMAPEQWVGKSGTSVDIYALGVVFYELITGRVPYQADTPVAILIMQTNDPLPRPISLIPNLPEAVESVIFKALAKKPEDRYPDMAAFITALKNLLSLSQKAAEQTIPLDRSPIEEVERNIPAANEFPRNNTPEKIPSPAAAGGWVNSPEKQRVSEKAEGGSARPALNESENAPPTLVVMEKKTDVLDVLKNTFRHRTVIIVGAAIILCIFTSIGAWSLSEGFSGRGILGFLHTPAETPPPVVLKENTPERTNPAPALQAWTATPIPFSTATPTHVNVKSSTPSYTPSFTPTLTHTLTPSAMPSVAATLTLTPTRAPTKKMIPSKTPVPTKREEVNPTSPPPPPPTEAPPPPPTSTPEEAPTPTSPPVK